MDSTNIMKITKLLSVTLLVALLFAAGCGKQQTQIPTDIAKDYCEEDSDCVCGGKDVDRSCFLGNRAYYDKYVDKSKDCPDFCTGIAGNLVLRCLGNKCTQTFECIKNEDCASGTCQNNKCISPLLNKYAGVTTTCTSDNDCVKDGCSATICRHKNAEPVFTTCEYKTEYSCYNTDAACGCVSGQCQWKK
ncbi:MAG: eight-cysteine-cluster domain-containing protein, partial [Nanoarchaeota archaeon]|nr:eight-cysteine-cluster domain-containing protein [Nanoarchaeota archaeon]